MAYFIAMILTFADFFGILAIGGYLLYLYYTNELLIGHLMVFIPIAIVLFILIPVIDKFRQKARTARKFDKYGRMKQFSQYEKMSVKEQKEFDKQRMKDMERLLPSTMVKEITKRGSSDPDADLNNLVGLENVKVKVEEMEARMEMERKSRKSSGSKHMVFFGPPGTGKTTVVSIMTAYLYKYGYIKDNRFMMLNGSFFTSDDASKKIEAVVARAFGGVLFIDEAYALLQGAYGEEAVSTLLSQMEDNRDKFVLILAGYEAEMKELLRSNPGFLSRVSEFLYFENYSEEELLGIFCSMAKSEGYRVDEGGRAKFIREIRKAMHEYSFGNARTCRMILDKSISRHCLNVKRGTPERHVLTEEDIYYAGNPLA